LREITQEIAVLLAPEAAFALLHTPSAIRFYASCRQGGEATFAGIQRFVASSQPASAGE
jgi:hypothetical protein